MPVPLVPADQCIENGIAKVGRVVVELEMAAGTDDRTVGKGHSREGVEADVYILPANRDHDAKADVPAQDLFGRNIQSATGRLM